MRETAKGEKKRMTDIFVMFAIASFICSAIVAEQLVISIRKIKKIEKKLEDLEVLEGWKKNFKQQEDDGK